MTRLTCPMKRLIPLFIFCLVPALPAQEKSDEPEKKPHEKRLRLAEELESLGDYDRALQILEELSHADPENSKLREKVIGLLLRTERYGEAIPLLREKLELEDGSVNEHVALGQLMIQAEELETAVSFLEEASERFPDSAEIAYLLTFPLTQLERWEAATEQFEKTITLAEDANPRLLNGQFYFQYGAGQERAGNFAEAETLLRKAIELIEEQDPNVEQPEFLATVLNYLAYMWIDRGENLEEAGPMAQNAAKLDPSSGAIADTVGWYFFQKGEYPQALVWLKKAVSLIEFPDPVILDHLGQTLVKLDEKEIAAEYFREALELDPKNEELKERISELGEE